MSRSYVLRITTVINIIIIIIISYSGAKTNINFKLYLNEASCQALPTTVLGNTGFGLFWNISGGNDETDYLNFAQGGCGKHSFYSMNP